MSRSFFNARRDLFANVIESFGHKIAAAYVFALIDGAVRRKLDLIRKIRNEFAHEILANTEGTERLTFQSPPIKDRCAALEYPNWFPRTVSDPKERFCLSVLSLSLDLRSAHEIRPMDRQPPPGSLDQLRQLMQAT